MKTLLFGPVLVGALLLGLPVNVHARWPKTLATELPIPTAGKPSVDDVDYPALFHKLDLDGDNKLSLQEFLKLDPMTVQTPALKNADLTAVFHKLDTDNDSKLSLDEFLKISSLAAESGTPGVATPPPI